MLASSTCVFFGVGESLMLLHFCFNWNPFKWSPSCIILGKPSYNSLIRRHSTVLLCEHFSHLPPGVGFIICIYKYNIFRSKETSISETSIKILLSTFSSFWLECKMLVEVCEMLTKIYMLGMFTVRPHTPHAHNHH